MTAPVLTPRARFRVRMVSPETTRSSTVNERSLIQRCSTLATPFAPWSPALLPRWCSGTSGATKASNTDSSPAPMPSSTIRRNRSALRRQQAALTRSRILDAALGLFFRDGYAATTLKSIAVEADVAIQTGYAVFGSKQAILTELRWIVVDLPEADSARLEAMHAPTPEDRLSRFAHSIRRRLGTGRRHRAGQPGRRPDRSLPQIRDPTRRGPPPSRNQGIRPRTRRRARPSDRCPADNRNDRRADHVPGICATDSSARVDARRLRSLARRPTHRHRSLGPPSAPMCEGSPRFRDSLLTPNQTLAFPLVRAVE